MRLRALYHDHQLSLETPIDIGGAQLAGLLVPGALQIAAPDEALAADIEDIRKIRLDRHLEDQANRVGGVVDQLVVLVDAFEDRPVEADADRPLLEQDVVLG